MMHKILRIAQRTVIGVSLLALTAGVVGAGAVAFVFHRAQPDYTGQDKIASLSAPATIYRDAYGIPHIFAATWEDAARALGYTHAGERLFQMEMQRRAGQGRLAELVGTDVVGIDKFTRTLGLYTLAQSSYAAMSPEAQRYFQAYADGVNAWLATHKNTLPPEFLLLHATPEPWQPEDSVVWGKLMALQLSHNYHLELLRAELAQKLPAEQMQWLFPMPPAGTPVTTQPVDDEHVSRDDGNRLASLLGLDHAASNEWVVGGARTATGKPILANDPHLDLEAPILWYLARIVTPEGSVKGATVPGLPIVLLGQNDHLAWGFTTTGSDVQDLFVETLDPQNASNYITPDGSAPFTEHNETIHVKNAPDVTITVRATRHGPVLSDIEPEMAQLAGAGKVMALAFTGLGDKDRTSESLMRINRAHNAAEMFDALHLYQTPPQNIVYADSDGNFGYINPGLVPVRKNGDGLMPADGASGTNDWVGTVPFDHLPQTANPAAGYVFNANNTVVDADSTDYFGQDWEETYRARRLQQFFDSHEKFTVAMSEAIQADHLSLAAKDFLPYVTSLHPQDDRAKQALDMLRAWDGVMDKDRPEPAIFEAWLYEFHNRMLPQKTGVDTQEKGPFAATTLDSLIQNHAQDWCGDSDCRVIATQSFDDAIKLMTQRQGAGIAMWRWGRENIAQLKHKFYSHVPLLKDLSDLSVASSGDFYTLDRGGGFDNDADHPFARTHGGGFRGIYDLADPDASLFMITTGESGHIFSSHYGDLVSLWNQVKAITLAGSVADMEQRRAAKFLLEP
jgi:penicillin amidase